MSTTTGELPPSITDGIRDTRLLTRAIKERWDIPETYKKSMINRQVKIASGLVGGTSAREETSAFIAVLAAEAQNQADEQHANHRMDEGRNRILAMLGGDGPSKSPAVVEQRGESLTRISDSKAPQRKAAGKSKGQRRSKP